MLIGLFDSGVGGLSVMAACKKVLPACDFLYLDDSANAPYGDRSDGEIEAFSRRNLHLLFSAGCDAAVMACNTATSVCADKMRAAFPDKTILGLEPAVKPALAENEGRVLLLATPVTAKHRFYPPRVTVKPEKTLAAEVEKAYGDPEKLRMLAEMVYGECRAEGEFSVIVTGCSHYAHLAPYFPCKVYDGAEGVARRLLSLIGSSRK